MAYQPAGISLQPPVILETSLTLNTLTDVGNLFTQPLILVPACQSNQVIVPISVVARTWSGNPHPNTPDVPWYTGSSQSYDIAIGYNTSTQVADFLTSLSSTTPNVQHSDVLTFDAVPGAPLVVYAPNAVTQTGTMLIKIYCTYQLFDVS